MQIADQYQTLITTQSYGQREIIDGVELIDRPFHADDGGNFTELVRMENGQVVGLDGFEAQQASLSVMLPGVIKAFHLHHNQDDLWYVSPYHRVVVNLVDLRADSPTRANRMRLVLGGGTNRLLRIPAGVAHGAANLTQEPQYLWYFVTQTFNAQAPDEHRLPWDAFGAEMWELQRG